MPPTASPNIRRADGEGKPFSPVRDPVDGLDVVLVKCRGFSDSSPRDQETGRISLRSSGVQALGALLRQRLSFDRTVFANDPKIRGTSRER
jgi:hypothetical protein